MKYLGIIGGMSWESSIEYYRQLNEGVSRTLGGLHSAPVLMNSVDFDEYEGLQHSDSWEEISRRLSSHAAALERAGASAILLSTNTMHEVAPAIEEAIGVPFIHIAKSCGRKISADGVRKLGLLGTSFTMQRPFYRSILEQDFGLEVMIPEGEDQDFVHQLIYTELCKGQFLEASRTRLSGLISRLAVRGAEAVLLACTELPLLIQNGQADIPLYDSMQLHIADALDFLVNS